MTGSRFLLRFFNWLGGHELALLLAFAGIAAGIWAFAQLANEVAEGDTQTFDRTVLLAMRRPTDLEPRGPAWVQEAARDITSLGGAAVLAILTASVAGFLALDGKGRLALLVCGSVASAAIMSGFLKGIFERPRPALVPYADVVSSSSFPSGHSMMSALTYLVLGALLARSQERKVLKAYFLLLATLLTLLIGVSRVYLGVHWPTDVLAGWSAGAVWAILSWLVARRLHIGATVDRAQE
jgi:undecaprenyl-diphosphatase